ncbi:hypothetical protein FUT69_10870 [Xylella taiwanensis]|uniref:Uncharacterized protein n=1 Tax=Xylella taiwanensis TaxID=1444770 RepID=A0ABS8TRK1_9GAMM|nr:hypothetical protein [Xylella taiwanensis]MCD8456852.1 hypothetical protein [Xylella taiwanensis]MCD8459261.1 hypothetical protein [Xylella taiwanensis]MCD8461866.1 hypothetical protein [Xylella taiwanensis]MCD8462103.1 hypothetical protein [Xylella taiwanensis]MCD8465886.1 hypothetical protein [Xylella taiwanensis]
MDGLLTAIGLLRFLHGMFKSGCYLIFTMPAAWRGIGVAGIVGMIATTRTNIMCPVRPVVFA